MGTPRHANVRDFGEFSGADIWYQRGWTPPNTEKAVIAGGSPTSRSATSPRPSRSTPRRACSTPRSTPTTSGPRGPWTSSELPGRWATSSTPRASQAAARCAVALGLPADTFTARCEGGPHVTRALRYLPLDAPRRRPTRGSSGARSTRTSTCSRCCRAGASSTRGQGARARPGAGSTSARARRPSTPRAPGPRRAARGLHRRAGRAAARDPHGRRLPGDAARDHRARWTPGLLALSEHARTSSTCTLRQPLPSRCRQAFRTPETVRATARPCSRGPTR
jgi:hypothetical protein